jgi:porin
MPSSRCIFIFAAVMTFALAGIHARAEVGDGGTEISPPATSTTTPPKSFWTGDYLTQPWLGVRDKWQAAGISFRPDWTGEVFGNPSGGARKGVVSDGVFELPLAIDFDPLTGGAVKDLTFKASAFYIYGSNLSQSFVGDFSISSNIAAYNTLRLDELWLQKGLWNNTVTVRVGNQGVDNEFFVSSSAALFVGSTFGSFTLISNNPNNAFFPPVYPIASPGVRINYQPDAHYYVMAGVYGIDKGLKPDENDKDGTRFALDADGGMLIMAEAGYLLNQGKNEQGLQGTYRLGSFLNTLDFPTFASQADAELNGGPLRPSGVNYGIYGVVDQQLYAEGPRNITIFARPGGAPSNTNFVDYYVDGGFNFTGFLPGRDKDVAGLAVARSHVSKDFSNAQVAEGNALYSAETYLEATYKLQLTPWWNIQPDFQYVITPSGEAGSHNATVIGVRTYVLF